MRPAISYVASVMSSLTAHENVTSTPSIPLSIMLFAPPDVNRLPGVVPGVTSGGKRPCLAVVRPAAVTAGYHPVHRMRASWKRKLPHLRFRSLLAGFLPLGVCPKRTSTHAT